MDPFFTELGHKVLQQWKQENFSLEKFPEIACRALEERPPAEHVDLNAFIKDFLIQEIQPPQSQSGFGQPELVVFEHSRFYIQVLFWLDGTTDIHQHEFSGAFHVMAGSSIHAQYAFENAQPITPHLQVGDVRMQHIELLETGRTVPIRSGKTCIHSLFHLDTPSITVVVRTQHDPGTGPQFNYLPPGVAMDPDFSDTLTMRRKQLLAVLEQIDDPDYPEWVREMIAELDFERGFFIMESSMSHLRSHGEWDATLATFEQKHGAKAKGISATLEECMRRDLIKELRGSVTEPEHRFFMALLLNVPEKGQLLQLVKQRFPEEEATETILRWIEELTEVSDLGVIVLDAAFPEEWQIPIERQWGLFSAAIRHFVMGAKKAPAALRELSAAQLKELRTILADSSLRLLVS